MATETRDPLDAAALDELLRLEREATKAEWKIEGESIVTDDVCIAVIEDDGGYEAPGSERKANAALIVAMRNAIVSLVEAARDREAAREAAKRLREQINHADRLLDHWQWAIERNHGFETAAQPPLRSIKQIRQALTGAKET